MINDDLTPQINLQNTTPVNGSTPYQQGYIFRKVSKFLIGSDEDALVPVPVFFNAFTGEILTETLPESIRGDYENTTTTPLSLSNEGETSGDNQED